MLCVIYDSFVLCGNTATFYLFVIVVTINHVCTLNHFVFDVDLLCRKNISRPMNALF